MAGSPIPTNERVNESPSRRHFVVNAVAAGTLLLTSCKAPADTPAPARTWLRKPDEKPFQIPNDFLGIHTDHGMGGPSPAPSYRYGAVRSINANDERAFPITQWALIELKDNEFDWSPVEKWLAANPGKTKIFNLFGCPTFHQKFPKEPWAFPYLQGGGSPPKDPALAARFIKALLAKFPGEIQFIELWNEPNFGWDNDDLLKARWGPTKGLPAFFTGSPADLAGMARAVREVLPKEVLLMSSGWEGQGNFDSSKNSLLRFSKAPDGRGRTGKDHVQALSVHSYTYENDPNKLVNELLGYRERFEEAGYDPSLPRFLTEVGAEAPGAWNKDTPSMTQKTTAIRRWCMIPAALGYSGVYLYKHSVLETLGDPAANPEISKAIDDIYEQLSGKRIKAAAELKDDTIWLQFDDDSELRA